MPFRYVLGENESPSNGVITSLAAVKGCTPLELEPLGEIIDPDALDALVRERSVEVTFLYAGWLVTVTGEEIEIWPLAREEDVVS